MMVPAYKLSEEQTLYAVDVPGTELPTGRRPQRGGGANPYVVLPIVGLVLFAAGLAMVGQRVQWMTLTYELEAARQQLAALQQTHARLQVAAVGAASLDKMETTARTRLGMVDPDVRTAVVVAADASLVPMVVEAPSALAAVVPWLRERLTTTAEAGERSPR